MTTYTTTDKLKCIRRELSMRRHVYPGWVARGTMKQAKADHEIAVLEAIERDYTKIQQDEQPSLGLDGEGHDDHFKG